MVGIIYKATNKTTGKSYIGKTVKTLNRRKYEHHSFGKRLTKFQNAIKKHGKEDFEWSILLTCSSYEELDSMERKMIKDFDSIKNGYNLTEGGDGAAYGELNVSKRKDVREKLKIACSGWFHSEETKEEIRKKIKGTKLSNKTKSKISKSLKKSGKLKGIFEGEKSVNAKRFLIFFPDGTEKEIVGLKKFCRDFKLDAKSMRRVARNEQDNHKGFKCKYV